MPRKAYVEDAADEDNRVAVVDAPPRAPSPPPNFNVFEFLVDAGPAQSPPPEEDDAHLLDDREWESDPDDMEAERYDSAEDTYAAAREYMKVEMLKQGYTYGEHPVNQSDDRFQSHTQLPLSPAEGQFYTPANPRGHQRNISNASMDSATRESNKKRKRGHVEELNLARTRAYQPNGDVVMTDAAPVMHSGLTGGLNRLLSRPELPPSPPEMDGIDASPHSPLKRTKHSNPEKERGRTRETDRDRKASRRSSDKKDRDSKEKEHKKHKSSHRESDSANKAGRWERRRPLRKESTEARESAPRKQMKAIEAPFQMKAIEYKPANGESEAHTNGTNGALIVHPKRALSHAEHSAISNAEHFMSFVTKGPESERGFSINKVLKRYHRDKNNTRGRSDEEKDLWKVLRLRRNDRGETVLFVDGVP